MAKKTKTLKREITSEGEAVFPWLNQPHTRFNPDGVYSVILALPADADIFERIEEIVKDFKASMPDNVQFYHPIKIGVRDKISGKVRQKNHDDPVDENEEVITDTQYLKFKTAAKWPDGTSKRPSLFDHRNKPLGEDETIHSGSRIQVSFTPMTYHAANNCGVTLLLDAVKVLEFAPNRDSAGAYGFTEQDQPAEDDTENSSAQSDIPF